MQSGTDIASATPAPLTMHVPLGVDPAHPGITWSGFYEFHNIAAEVVKAVADHGPFFLPRVWIAAVVRCHGHPWEPALTLTLDRMEAAHRLFPHPPQLIQQIEQKWIIAPAARVGEWLALKDATLAVFVDDTELAYAEVQARLPTQAEPDVKASLMTLSAPELDGRLTCVTPDATSWADAKFRRSAAA